MKRAMIFSMDGLMVNCSKLHDKVWNSIMNIHGHDYSQVPSDMKATFPGMRTIDICHLVVDHLSLEVEPQVLCAERDNEFLATIKNGVEPLPGLLDALARFKQAGFKLAIASSGSSDYIEHVIDHLDIRNYFAQIISGDGLKRGKPSPEIYLVAAKEIGVSPSECLVIEDTTNGIAAAKGAGCYCIAVNHGQKRSIIDADLVVNSLGELDPAALHRL